MHALLSDLRFALRSWRRTPHLSLAAVACVALGAGAAVFIFTISNAVLRTGPPFPDAERLVRIWTFREGVGQRGDLSYLDARDLLERTQSFDGIEMAARTRAALTTTDGTERIRGESVTPGYFSTIGVAPTLGREFSDAEHVRDADRVIIISHALWTRKFGQRTDIVGQSIIVRGSVGLRGEADQPFTIIGVMPRNFAGTVDTDMSEFWLPIEQYTPRTLLDMRTARSTWVLARLRPGATPEMADTEVRAIGRQLAEEHPNAYRDISFAVEPVGETWRERFRSGLRLLNAAAALLLIIASANIAHLLLARLAQRQNELELRVILGARSAVIVRQLVVESLVLAFVGGVIGTAIAIAGVKYFAATQVFQLPPYVTITIGAAVPLIALTVIAIAAILSGVLPAWLSARSANAPQIRAVGGAAVLGRASRRTLDTIVGVEVAFSFVLLVATTLMIRSYSNLVRSDVGFRTSNVQRLAITLNPNEFPDPAAQHAFARDAKAALAATPGVEGVTFVSGILPPWFDPEVAVGVAGVAVPGLASVNRHAVDEDFFRVLEIPIREGRGFETVDRTDTRRVAVVSRSLAATIAQGQSGSVVGRTIQYARNGDSLGGAVPVEIVGIADDVKYHGPKAVRSGDFDLYVPAAQVSAAVWSVAVTTTRDPGPLLAGMQKALGALAPSSPIHWVSTMDAELGLQYTDARLYAWLTAVFGGSALLLVSLGIYGLVSNAVTRRYAELGVRMAVGARPADIGRLVVSYCLRPVIAGVVAGALIAAASAKLAGTLVYDIAPTDAASYAGVAVLIVGVGLVACYLPARRATRVDLTTILQRP